MRLHFHDIIHCESHKRPIKILVKRERERDSNSSAFAHYKQNLNISTVSYSTYFHNKDYQKSKRLKTFDHILRIFTSWNYVDATCKKCLSQLCIDGRAGKERGSEGASVASQPYLACLPAVEIALRSVTLDKQKLQTFLPSNSLPSQPSTLVSSSSSLAKLFFDQIFLFLFTSVAFRNC